MSEACRRGSGVSVNGSSRPSVLASVFLSFFLLFFPLLRSCTGLASVLVRKAWVISVLVQSVLNVFRCFFCVFPFSPFFSFSTQKSFSGFLQMISLILIVSLSTAIAQQTPNVARHVVPPFTASGLTIDDNVGTNEENWFRFEASAGDTVTVSLTFTHSNGDIDSRMYSNCGSTTASCTGKRVLFCFPFC